jgi:hypothetical protein
MSFDGQWSRRFIEGDGSTFVVCTSVISAAQFVKELQLAPQPNKFRYALLRTSPLVTPIAFSVGVGIFSVNASIAAIQELKRHDHRTSMLLAFPLAGGLLYVPKGPKAMAKGAAALGIGAYALTCILNKSKKLLSHEEEK